MISNLGHVMTLANSIIGVGILAMPFCFQKCGIILSILLLVLNYLVTRISCHYLIKTSLITRRRSIEFLAFHAFGSSGKLMVELCIIGYLMGTCIAYFVLVGDLGPQIVAKILDINEDDNLRTWVMIFVTILCIIPLGMLKNVDSLSVVCTATIGFYFCLVLKVIGESEFHIMSNDWMEHVEYWQPSGILQCLPIFSMALSCQMQLFEVFETIPNQSLDKMNEIVKNSTRICTCVYILVGFFGYIAFCTQTFSGNILVNFSQSLGSDAIKIGFVLSVAFSFPLVIFPCRATIFSLLYRKGHVESTSGYISEYQFKTITLFIVLLTLCLGLLIPSIEIVMGLMGSTIGVAICIMFPASCFLKISKKESTEKSLAHVILIGGFCLMILGTYANLNAIDEKNSGISPKHDQYNFENLKHIENSKIIENISENIQQIIKPDLPIKKLSNNKFKSTFDTKILKEKINQDINALRNKKIELNQNNLNNNVNVNIETKPKIISTNKFEPPKVNILPDIKLNKSFNNNSNNNNMINKEAIAKKDEVAAEETAKEDKETKLEKAENDLRKTKKMFEKKVDELKLEIAKQNKETQNLVVAKLDDIVGKVEQIEREVHEVSDDQKLYNDNKIESTNIKIKQEHLLQKPNHTQYINKDSLIGNILSKEQKINETANNEKESIILNSNNDNKSIPYEPLSYKTGEILNRIPKNQNIRVALPLPLLINSSKGKDDDNINNIGSKPVILESILISEKPDPKIEEIKHQAEEKVKEKENIEAIRRDILSAYNDDTTTIS